MADATFNIITYLFCKQRDNSRVNQQMICVFSRKASIKYVCSGVVHTIKCTSYIKITIFPKQKVFSEKRIQEELMAPRQDTKEVNYNMCIIIYIVFI